MQQDIFIGLDIGGGSAKIGLVDAVGTILARQRIPVVEGEAFDQILAAYGSSIESLLAEAKVARPKGIGIGFPGHILPDLATGANSNVPALDGKPMVETLARRFGCQTRMVNDADAGAIAEYRFGAGRGVRRLLLITVGTGIGVSLVVDGAPLSAANGTLGDAGHVVLVSENPVRCRQGCLGCLESVASGEAIEVKALGIFPKAAEGTATASLVRAAIAGQAEAAALMAEAGRWIGMAAATWCNIFAPDRILIGGGISAVGDPLVAAIRDEARRRTMPYNIRHTDFALAALGNDAGIIGAAAVVMF
jgi:glucokinase